MGVLSEKDRLFRYMVVQPSISFGKINCIIVYVRLYLRNYIRGKVVTNVVSTCDPAPLYYMQLNIIKLTT